MNKDLDNIVNSVARAMDLLPSQILSKCKSQELTDARWIVVYMLREEGYYSARISEWMGMTSRNVNLIISAMNNRLQNEKRLRSNLESARKEHFREVTKLL